MVGPAKAGANLKPLGRCESVKLLGLLAELHGDVVVPLLPRILQVVVTRLQDADLHLREACAETVFRLARALVTDMEGSPVFATLLKPLFGALTEHNKWVQIGAASSICSVIQGSPPPVIRENLLRLCQRLVHHLALPLAMAKPQLLSACVYAMQAVEGVEFDEVLPVLMPCLEGCLSATSDWQTRKQAIEVLQAIGDSVELGQSLELPPPAARSAGPTPLQRRIALVLETIKTDKVMAVRQAVKDVLLKWQITKVGLPHTPTAARSNSPSQGAAWSSEQREAMRPSAAARSGSPTGGSGWPEREASRGAECGSAGNRQNRSVKASSRDRDTGEVPVTVMAPERPKVADFHSIGAATEMAASGPEKNENASEKAARNNAVKAALSGAIMNSTKKPRPNRDRQSIFNGPANANFFKSAQIPSGNAPAIGGDAEEERELSQSEVGDGDPAYFEEPYRGDELRMDEEEVAVPMKDARHISGHSSGVSTKAPTPSAATHDDVVIPTHAAGHFNAGPPARVHHDNADWLDSANSVDAEDVLWPCDGAPDVFKSRAIYAPDPSDETAMRQAPGLASQEGGHSSAIRQEGQQESPDNDEEEVDSLFSMSRHGHRERRASSPNQGDEGEQSTRPSAGDREVHSRVRRGSALPRRRSSNKGNERSPDSSPSRSQASLLQSRGPARLSQDIDFNEVELPGMAGSPNAGGTTSTTAVDWPWESQPIKASKGSSRPANVELLESQLDQLGEIVASMKEEKREMEEQLLTRLAALDRTCESQSELLSKQQQQMELQEQQMRAQEQRLHRQEQQLQRQEKQLLQQELLLQQQDQQLEQQDQQLREHTQLAEQQENQLEEHKTCISELQRSVQAGHSMRADEGNALTTLVAGASEVRSDVDPKDSLKTAANRVSRLGSFGRPSAEGWSEGFDGQHLRMTPLPLPIVSVADSAPSGASLTTSAGGLSGASGALTGSSGGLAGSSGDRPTVLSMRDIAGKGILQQVKGVPPKKSGLLWEKVIELCDEQRFLEAYKQVIAEPEESCLLRLMQHTGPIVEKLDAESNSRLIRRLIHILSSPSKEPAVASVGRIFAWLWQALEVGIHFTSSQVEDLAAALQKVSAPHANLPASERAEAARLLTKVSALRRL